MVRRLGFTADALPDQPLHDLTPLSDYPGLLSCCGAVQRLGDFLDTEPDLTCEEPPKWMKYEGILPAHDELSLVAPDAEK